MKRIVLLLLLLIQAITFTIQAQQTEQQPSANAKKPTLMLLPSDNWCAQRYFITSFDNQGIKVDVPNYQQAFREDLELNPVISKIGALLTDMGYTLKDAEQELKRIAERTTENHNTTAKNSGASLAESPLDILKKRTKADIIIQIAWNVNTQNTQKSVTFTLEAFDAYTSKRIATATGTGNMSSDIIPVLLETAVKEHIISFDSQMDRYYSAMQNNGREIVLTINRWNNWDRDLESEISGQSLLDIIQKWLRENTVNANFNITDATENEAQFEQVHIPLYDKNGIALDARAFAVLLQKYLKTAPYNITSKILTRGLGEAILILGEQ